MELLFSELKHITNSLNLLFDRNDASWVCNIELSWLEFLNYQDDIVEALAKIFCKTYYGRKILL